MLSNEDSDCVFYPPGTLEYMLSEWKEVDKGAGYPCTSCIGRGQARPKLSSLKLPRGAFTAAENSGSRGKRVGRGRGRKRPDSIPGKIGNSVASSEVESFQEAAAPPGEELSEPAPDNSFTQQWVQSHFSVEGRSEPRFTAGVIKPKSKKKPSVDVLLDIMDDLSAGNRSVERKYENVTERLFFEQLPAALVRGLDKKSGEFTANVTNSTDGTLLKSTETKPETEENSVEKSSSCEPAKPDLDTSVEAATVERGEQELSLKGLGLAICRPDSEVPNSVQEESVIKHCPTSELIETLESSQSREELPRETNVDEAYEHYVTSPVVETKEETVSDAKADDQSAAEEVGHGATPVSPEERTLVVPNLPSGCDGAFLEHYFMSYGGVECCQIHDSTAEVTFSDDAFCDWALSCLDGGIEGLFPDHPDVVITGYKKSEAPAPQ